MLVYPVKFLPKRESTSPSYITTQIVKERIPTDLDQGTNGSGVCHCRLSPGGARRDRTADPLLAKQVLSQLSYGPVRFPIEETMVGLGRFELPTSPLSGVRSNQLSYRPAVLDVKQADCVDAFTPNSRTFKEVIQPQVPLGLPCYDFTPVMNHTVVSVLPKVRLPTSGTAHSHGVTGGVYKARERIHRGILIHDY